MSKPVERTDSWCKFYDFESAKKRPADPNVPWGYVMTIPNYRDGMEIEPEGYVVRTKLCKAKKLLLLQVVTGRNWFCEGRIYGTTIQFPKGSAQNTAQKEEKLGQPKKRKKGKKHSNKRRKRKKRYFNIRNLSC